MDYDYDKLLGERISSLREQKGWSQEETVAKLQTNGCDITRSTLAKVETGQRHLYSYEIKQLKEVLDVSFEELFI